MTVINSDKAQKEIDDFYKVLNIDLEVSIDRQEAANAVKCIADCLPVDKKEIFAKEWSLQYANGLQVTESSIQSAGVADIAMLYYAQRFYK